MNETLKTITTRRSVKCYKSTMVEKKLIKQVVNAGISAPSGKNLQSPIILVITNKNVRDQLSELCAKIRRVKGDPFYNAPVILIVLAKKDVSTRVYDGSCVIENMLIAAHALNLGACWIHHAKEMFETIQGKKLLKSIGIDDEYEGIGNCILGYPEYINKNPVVRKQNSVFYI